MKQSDIIALCRRVGGLHDAPKHHSLWSQTAVVIPKECLEDRETAIRALTEAKRLMCEPFDEVIKRLCDD